MSTTPAAGNEQTQDLKRTLKRLLSTFSLLSALGAAAIGTVAALFLGPPLAMGLSFYTGNTEPRPPSAAYPWHLLAACVVTGAVGVLLLRRDREAVGHLLLHLAAIAAALLPLLHIYELWLQANLG